VSPGCAGDGCFEFPRAPHPSALQVAKSPGFPASSTVLYRLSMQPSGLPEFCIFRLFRRWFIEFPRAPHPSALLEPNLQVSPSPRLWLRLAMSLRVSPNPHLPGAGDGSSSFLESHPSAPPSSNIRVSPVLRLKQRLSIDSPGLPGSSCLPAAPAMVPRVSSNPASFSGTGVVKLRVSPSPRSSSSAC